MRFSDLDYLMKVGNCLQISDFWLLPASQCIVYLKEAKEDYLLHKEGFHKLHYEHIEQLSALTAAKKRNAEKIKFH